MTWKEHIVNGVVIGRYRVGPPRWKAAGTVTGRWSSNRSPKEKDSSVSPSPTGPKIDPSENFLEKLVKIMGLTGSSNDGEALAALRMGTALLAKNNYTWEKILRGKVKVVASPFAPGQRPTTPPETKSRGTPTPTARPIHSGTARRANPNSSFGHSSTINPTMASTANAPFGAAYTTGVQASSHGWKHPSGYGFGNQVYLGNDMCHACQGIGEDMSNRTVPCHACQGSGKQYPPKKPAPGTGNCKRCGGTGIYTWAPGKSGSCFNCQGTGSFTGRTAPKSHARGPAPDLDTL